METLDLVWLIPALPLLGFLTLLVAGRKLGEPLAGWFATAMVGGSFAVSVAVFFGLLDRPGEDRAFVQTLFEWIPAGGWHVDVGFLADPLSVTMCLFVTGVGTLIHLYSVGYMHGDENFAKFFVYLNLFAFSMLMLVLGDNLLITFLGWEGWGRARTSSSASGSPTRSRPPPARRPSSPTASVTGGSWWPSSPPSPPSGRSTTPTSSAGPAVSPTSTATFIAFCLFIGAIGQVGPVPAVRVAARRHGRPHPRVRADPRRHHGDVRRLPADPGQPDPR